MVRAWDMPGVLRAGEATVMDFSSTISPDTSFTRLKALLMAVCSPLSYTFLTSQSGPTSLHVGARW